MRETRAALRADAGTPAGRCSAGMRVVKLKSSPRAVMDVIVAALIALCLVAVLFIVHLRGRGKRDSQKEDADR